MESTCKEWIRKERIKSVIKRNTKKSFDWLVMGEAESSLHISSQQKLISLSVYQLEPGSLGFYIIEFTFEFRVIGLVSSQLKKCLI